MGIERNNADIRREIFTTIHALSSNKIDIADETPLIGGGSILDSLNLVELCLKLEDLASEIGFEFDWTSSNAMSNSRSMFRTAGSLADEFIKQKEKE